MASLEKSDVLEIIKMLEDELNLIPKVDKMQKMKMRGQIRKQVGWLLSYRNPSANRLYTGLEHRLPEVFSIFPYDFCHHLIDDLEIRLMVLRKRDRQRPTRIRTQIPTPQ
jgi:hypothetical protein